VARFSGFHGLYGSPGLRVRSSVNNPHSLTHTHSIHLHHPFERQVNFVAVAFVSKNRRKSINECFSFWLQTNGRRAEASTRIVERESWARSEDYGAPKPSISSATHHPPPPTFSHFPIPIHPPIFQSIHVLGIGSGFDGWPKRKASRIGAEQLAIFWLKYPKIQ